MLPLRIIWTCPNCLNREERPGDDTTSDWGCPNCGTWMRKRGIYPRRSAGSVGGGPAAAVRETR